MCSPMTPGGSWRGGLHTGLGWRVVTRCHPACGPRPLAGAPDGGPRSRAPPHRHVPPCRAEPALARIQEDRRRIVLPAIDNIKYDTFEVQQYASAAHGYNWGLWCMYIIPPQDWLDRGDEAAPIR